jgi:hypothetical protein
MPCGTEVLTASRKKTGSVKMKGYRAISFSAFDTGNLITATAGVISSLPVALTEIHRFEVKNTADNFIETWTRDLVTNTGSNEGVGTFALLYCDRVKNIADAKALENGIWNVFFETHDGLIIVAGITNGAHIMTTVESTDAQGFLFTLNTSEPNKAPHLTGTAITEYNAAIVAYA